MDNIPSHQKHTTYKIIAETHEKVSFTHMILLYLISSSDITITILSISSGKSSNLNKLDPNQEVKLYIW